MPLKLCSMPYRLADRYHSNSATSFTGSTLIIRKKVNLFCAFTSLKLSHKPTDKQEYTESPSPVCYHTDHHWVWQVTKSQPSGNRRRQKEMILNTKLEAVTPHLKARACPGGRSISTCVSGRSILIFFPPAKTPLVSWWDIHLSPSNVRFNTSYKAGC